ncbi:MAG TPA: S8 family serine peptidase, partial [Vicinamibacterales bacterium]|nr:S8 family serine peptidase [Vicinamibacterales bacterium]
MKRVTAVAAVALALAASGALVIAQYPDEIVPLEPQPAVSIEPRNETPDLWFVEMPSPPAADGTSIAIIQAEQDAFRAGARAAGLAFTERYAFQTLWNGLSIRIDPADIGKLARVPGVAAIYPVAEVELARDDQPPADPDMTTALAMTGADIAQTALGLTGAGVRMAVMDTGIDYHHPDLGGCFGPGCRVEKGWDFVGDDFTGPASTPKPDPDPDDCGGHGTHVAGIAGANGVVRGVAPGVTFHAYRVFGCQGSTTTDIMLAAMERALADGADILTMSIGIDRAWRQDPTAVASDRLVNKGVVVTAAAGNAGSIGLYASAAPALGRKVISVAAINNTHLNLSAFSVSPDNRRFGYLQAAGA